MLKLTKTYLNRHEKVLSYRFHQGGGHRDIGIETLLGHETVKATFNSCQKIAGKA